MKVDRDRQRQLTVGFRQALTEDESHAIVKAIFSIDGVTGADASGARLKITYTFPEVTAKTILAGIGQFAGKAGQQRFSQFKNALLTFLETNERDHLVYADGWHRYIEDIYLRCSGPDPEDRIDIRNQTWRKYK